MEDDIKNEDVLRIKTTSRMKMMYGLKAHVHEQTKSPLFIIKSAII